jgi:hypothetical protein
MKLSEVTHMGYTNFFHSEPKKAPVSTVERSFEGYQQLAGIKVALDSLEKGTDTFQRLRQSNSAEGYNSAFNNTWQASKRPISEGYDRLSQVKILTQHTAGVGNFEFFGQQNSGFSRQTVTSKAYQHAFHMVKPTLQAQEVASVRATLAA